MPADHVVRPGRRWGGAGFHLGVGVAAWWLLIAAAVALLLPDAAASTPIVATGLPAHITLAGLVPAYPSSPIPVERAAFELAQRGYQESNERLLEAAFATSEWLTVTHGQRVTVVAIDDTAVQVEPLAGPYAGRRGWIKSSQIAP